MSSPKKKERPMHKVSFESLVSWGCICGGRWMNEKLKGKTDAQLETERELAFDAHVADMEAKGYW